MHGKESPNGALCAIWKRANRCGSRGTRAKRGKRCRCQTELISTHPDTAGPRWKSPNPSPGAVMSANSSKEGLKQKERPRVLLANKAHLRRNLTASSERWRAALSTNHSSPPAQVAFFADSPDVSRLVDCRRGSSFTMRLSHGCLGNSIVEVSERSLDRWSIRRLGLWWHQRLLIYF